MRPLLLAFCFCLAAFQVGAEERLFFQPLNSDAALGQEDWRHLWRDSAGQGVRTLIVQWSAYGDSDFGGRDGWLAQALREAREQGLEVVLGLYFDPAYFQRLKELDGPGLAAYWQYQLGRSLAQAQAIRDWELTVAGWYLPMELDDFHFHDPERRATLRRQLADFSARLDAPLHLSAFSGGHLAPRVLAAWLDDLAGLGIHVWWQDGVGTASLPAPVRQAYETALPCRVGVVREAFRQTSAQGLPFKAVPAEPQALDSGCRPAAVFELRYRPWGQRLLR
ncbi:DUF4434 domain-containing protein [Zestomonas carbonaria]|uniref:DUF4434 domain-containing protein n=1 Tax=Zestomonas carbonaria TaxID=2762745 RepID=A0A7U7EM42_9GAMM|nr:DUF4434 domain-containing protein [Pseudomonas carbonaria]CAD5107553.1 hypothetical protein PSEWESI4_01826 [Pseudomonas carbonaria]